MCIPIALPFSLTFFPFISLFFSHTDIHTSTVSPEDLPGVPVAYVSGGMNVTVKVRGTDSAPVSRVQVEAVVGGVHCLLAPSQLHILTEIASASLRSGGTVASAILLQLSILYVIVSRFNCG